MRPFRFSLYRRGRIWYASFYNPTTRRYTGGRSTGETVRSAAHAIVERWGTEGIPEGAQPRGAIIDTLNIDTILRVIHGTELTVKDAGRIVEALKARDLLAFAVMKDGPGAEVFVPFLERFWSYEESPYVREKLRAHHRIGKRHCYDMRSHVRVYWKPFFKEKRLAEITRDDLRAFSSWLEGEKGLAWKTINHVSAAGSTALRWAADEGMVAANPGEGLARFAGKPQKRGVLTDDEVRRLFAEPWRNARAYLGNMLAMSSGCRLGEVLAVQVRDIGEDRLHVRHSWSDQDGLKGTKTDEERMVPLLPDVRAALLELARTNPHGIGPSAFVFYSVDKAGRPMDAHPLQEELRAALVRLRLPTEDERKDPAKVLEAREYWKVRRVVFHSWRHLWAARMADKLEMRKVQTATGHRSSAMAEHYADHAAAAVFDEVKAVSADVFGRVLPFKKDAR